MLARDIMTRSVITVAPETTMMEIARVLLDHRISGVPVVRFGAVLGVVSVDDLIRRAAADGAEPPRGWLDLFATASSRAEAYVRSHGRRAHDVMTAPAVVVADDTPIADVAALMERRRVKRVPVLDGDGMLAGIISRANLLRGFASQRPTATAADPDDTAIRIALLAELNRHGWLDGTDPAAVIVESGVVHLWGRVRDQQVRRAMVIVAETTPGVRHVADHLDAGLEEELTLD